MMPARNPGLVPLSGCIPGPDSASILSLQEPACPGGTFPIMDSLYFVIFHEQMLQSGWQLRARTLSFRLMGRQLCRSPEFMWT